jgi:outer membrane protein assembly factor BamB
VSPVPAEGIWPSFRGPHGTGEATDLPPGEGPLTLELAWKQPLGSAYSGISIANNTLVTAGSYGDGDYVLALDPATGEERWRYKLAPAYRGHDGSHDGTVSTPAIADGRIFALSPSGRLAAIDLETGEPLWDVHLVDELGSEKPFYGFGSSPLVVGETMVLQIGGESGSVAGFDVATGEVRWRAVEDQIATESPILAEIAGRRQVLVLGIKSVAGLDPVDGAVLWEIEHEGGRGISAFSSPMPLGEDRIFVQYNRDATAVVGVTTDGARLVPTVLGTGRGMSQSYSPPTRAGQHVYGYTARFLSATDPSSGELLWRSREPGDGFLISIGDQLAVLTKTGGLHLGPASPEGWQETRRLDLFDELAWTPPSYAGGAIYARSLGEIARVNLVRGSTLAEKSAKRELPAALEALASEMRVSENPDGVLSSFLEGRDLPLVDGEKVVFLWRGDADDLAIAGDMIGMRREEPMHRLEGTDLWWWATELDRHARISYFFYVDYVPTTDPSHDRTVESTVLGADRNWNRGESVQMSWFAMPEWPGLTLAESTSTKASEPKGRTESFDLEVQPPATEDGEAREPVQATIQVWLPPGYAEARDRYPVVYIQDNHALGVGNWPQTLNSVVGESVAPLIVVFADLPRMPDGGKVFAEQVVPAVDERYRTLTDRNHRALVGMGWAGLVATATVFANSDLFGVLGVQSFYSLEDDMDWLRESIGDAEASTLPLRIYFEWGRWDLISPHENMNMRDWSRRAWTLLRDRGWQPIGGEVWDSTDWASWRNRTGVMLEALFPMEGTEPDLAAWQTGAP